MAATMGIIAWMAALLMHRGACTCLDAEECDASDVDTVSALQSRSHPRGEAKQALARRKHYEAVAAASSCSGSYCGENLVPPACADAGGSQYCPSGYSLATGNVCGKSGGEGWPCYAVGISYGDTFACPANMAASQWCSSGQNPNCPNPGISSTIPPSATNTGGAVYAWLFCNVAIPDMNGVPTTYYIEYDCSVGGEMVGCFEDSEAWTGCGSSSVVTGACTSGKDKNCGGDLMWVTCTPVPATATLGTQSSVCQEPLGGPSPHDDFITTMCNPGTVLTEVLQSGENQNIECNGQMQHSGAYCSPLKLSQEFNPDARVGFWNLIADNTGSITITQTITWSSSSSYSTTSSLTDGFSGAIGSTVTVGGPEVGGSVSASATATVSTSMTQSTSQTETKTNGGSSSIAVEVECLGWVWQWVMNETQAGTDMWALVKTNDFVCTQYGNPEYTPACPPTFCKTLQPTGPDTGCDCCVSVGWTTDSALASKNLCVSDA